MAGWRRPIELAVNDVEVAALKEISRSRSEPAIRVQRARILLAYRESLSFFAVGHTVGVHHQTVQRCVERAAVEDPMAALDDRPPPGKAPTITADAKAWIKDLACRKAKELGYPHELSTTRLLASHAREHGPAEGHGCLAKLAQAPSSISRRSSPTKCVITWNAVTRISSRRWLRFCVSIARSSSSRRRRRPPNRSRAMPSRSSPTTRSQEFRRSPTRRRTCHPSPACTRPSHAITNINAMALSVCWPVLICSPVRFTPSSGTVIAAANSSNFSSFSMPPIQLTQRSS